MPQLPRNRSEEHLLRELRQSVSARSDSECSPAPTLLSRVLKILQILLERLIAPHQYRPNLLRQEEQRAGTHAQSLSIRASIGVIALAYALLCTVASVAITPIRLIARNLNCRTRTRLNNADNFDADGSTDRGQCQGRSSVTCNHQQLDPCASRNFAFSIA